MAGEGIATAVLDVTNAASVAAALDAAVLALHRGEHDDPALALGHHFRRERADRVGSAVQIVVDHVPPIGIVHLQQRLPALDRGIGDHDVDLAMLAHDLVGNLPQPADVTNVGLDAIGFATVCPDLAHRLGQLRRRGWLRVGRGRNRAGDIARRASCNISADPVARS